MTIKSEDMKITRPGLEKLEGHQVHETGSRDVAKVPVSTSSDEMSSPLLRMCKRPEAVDRDLKKYLQDEHSTKTPYHGEDRHYMDMLELIHGDDQLPGVVRASYFPTMSDFKLRSALSEDPAILNPKSNTERRLTIQCHKSYGDPLSNCRDELHLLKVAYDAILGAV